MSFPAELLPHSSQMLGMRLRGIESSITLGALAKRLNTAVFYKDNTVDLLWSPVTAILG